MQLVIVPLYPLGYFFLLLALFIIFGPVKRYFYSLLGLWLTVTLLILFTSNEHGLERMFLSTILLNLVALAMTIVATLNKQEGSRIIFWGMACSFIAFGMAFLSPDFLAELLNINQSNSLFLLLFNMAAVSIPLSISLFLANEFATTHKGLAKQLKEVQHLSQLTLAQQEEKRQLQHLDTLKGRFFANLSHEFRTPLSLILGTVEKLQGQGVAASHMQADLGRVKENADKLLRMINQLLELSKLEAGKSELRPQVAELSVFLKWQAGVFIDLFKNKKISYHYTLPLLPVWVWMDKEKLELMISNLLSNAYKFTPAQGEVHFSASIAEEDTTQVSLQVIVQDTGIGISSHQLPHIFDRFYQADSSATRSFEGTGIGLSLIKELLEMLGGSIRVESQKEQGSTFTLQIPLQVAAPEAIEEVVEKEVPLAHSLEDALVGGEENRGESTCE
jgi:signal transduction histidine kinase